MISSSSLVIFDSDKVVSGTYFALFFRIISLLLTVITLVFCIVTFGLAIIALVFRIVALSLTVITLLFCVVTL